MLDGRESVDRPMVVGGNSNEETHRADVSCGHAAPAANNSALGVIVAGVDGWQQGVLVAIEVDAGGEAAR